MKFQGVEKLFEELSKASDTFIALTDVTPENFKDINNARELGRGRKFRVGYNDQAKVLFITIPSDPHETSYVWLFNRVKYQFFNMGLADEWDDRGHTLFRHEFQDSNKEPDAAGSPKDPITSGKRRWPTLVIEAGYSESWPQLKKDMEWWFSASHHTVKIVLLVKLQRTRKIELEKWVEVQQTTPSPLSQLLEHSTMISHRVGLRLEDPNSYILVRNDLVLEFERLFDRLPGPGEQDITIDYDMLREWASRIWA